MATRSLDIGVGDAHVPGAIGAPTGKASMAQSKSERRKAKLARAEARSKKQRELKLRKLALARKPADPGRNKSIHIRMTAPDGTHTTIRHTLSAIPGGSPAYYHKELGQLLTYVKIDKDEALASSDDGRVWVNVARVGTWAGHPQGAFRLDANVFEALVRNFRNSGVRRLQWDFNHASAMPPSSGNIPAIGTPSQGWIYDIKHDGQRLYVLTEWLPLARQYIENDQYDSASVVIAWDSHDRVTNAKIGPVLRSVALTNEPFVTGLQPLAADVNGVQSEQRGFMQLTEVAQGAEGNAQALSAKYSCHSVLGMLPRLKQTFGLHELATIDQVQAALENYRSHLDALSGNGLGSHEGVELGPYSLAMREMVNAHAGMDWYAILDIIDELIDAYLDQHDLPDFEDTHGPIPGGPTTENSAVATAASIEGVPMSEPQSGQAAAAVASAQAAATPETATAESGSAATVVTEVVAPEVQADATVTAASAAPVVEALPSPDLARLTLELAEARAELAASKAQVTALSAAAGAANTDAALAAEVDSTIAVYGKSKGLDASLRPHLLSMLKATPDAFRAMYPAVSPEQRHLLSNLTGGGASDPSNPGVRVEADTAAEIQDQNANPTAENTPQVLSLSFGDLVESLKRDHKLSHSAAMVRAEQLIKGRSAH